MTHHIEKYGDKFSGGQFYYIAICNLKFVWTWAPTNKIFRDIPDFNVLKYPHFAAPATHWWTISQVMAWHLLGTKSLPEPIMGQVYATILHIQTTMS